MIDSLRWFVQEVVTPNGYNQRTTPVSCFSTRSLYQAHPAPLEKMTTSVATPRTKKYETSAAIDNKNIVEQPLDYSFMNVTDLSEIEGEEPRCLPGKKKLERDDDEKFSTKCLKLNNNMLTDMRSFQGIVEKLLVNPMILSWLDLSFNHLTQIDPILCDYKNLQIIYLHGNDISEITEVDKLVEMPWLKKLALHGNPMEKVKNYRFYVLSHLPNLQSFDMSAVTKADRATASTWKRQNPVKKKKKKAEN